MCIRVDRQRAGVDSFENAQLAHQFQHVARPLDIDLFSVALVSHADFIPASDMKNAIHALHRSAHALLFGDITLVNGDTEIGKLLGFRRAAYTYYYLVAHRYKLACHMPSYKTGGSSDEVFHDAFSCCGNGLFADR